MLYSHVHLEEVSHGAGLLRLLDLELREELDEPLEALLVAVDPEEVDLAQVEHVGRQVVAPPVLALGALALHQPVTVHDGLQNKKERNSYSNYSKYIDVFKVTNKMPQRGLSKFEVKWRHCSMVGFNFYRWMAQLEFDTKGLSRGKPVMVRRKNAAKRPLRAYYLNLKECQSLSVSSSFERGVAIIYSSLHSHHEIVVICWVFNMPNWLHIVDFTCCKA